MFFDIVKNLMISIGLLFATILLIALFSGCEKKCSSGQIKFKGKCYEMGATYYRGADGKEKLI